MLFQFLAATHIPWLVSPFSISKASNGSVESFSHRIPLTLTLLLHILTLLLLILH